MESKVDRKGEGKESGQNKRERKVDRVREKARKVDRKRERKDSGQNKRGKGGCYKYQSTLLMFSGAF